jgi:hypothetical protein
MMLEKRDLLRRFACISARPNGDRGYRRVCRGAIAFEQPRGGNEMSTAIETLPSPHRVSWKGWVITLAAAALLAGAIGTYMALQSGSASPTKIIQTAKPATLVPVANLQPGAPAAGQVIAEMRDVGGVSGVATRPASDQGTKDTTDSSGPSSNTSGSSSTNCLSNVQGGPC